MYKTCQYQTLYQGQETKDGYCHQKLLAYSVPCLKNYNIFYKQNFIRQIIKLWTFLSTTTVCDCGVLESNKILVDQFFYKDCNYLLRCASF